MLSEEFVVGHEEAGGRLDLLSAQWLGLSRSAVQRLIKEGGLQVDGSKQPSSYKVREGERVEAQLPEAGLRAESIPVPVILEDEHILVVDKPAGLVVHPGAGNSSGTLVNALLEKGIEGGEDPLRPGVVHRLDRDTSGLMVLAKSGTAYSALVAALSKRRVSRVYRTVVVGTGLPPSGTVDAPVGRDPENPTLMAAGVGKSAVTHFEFVDSVASYSMLQVRLETGRTHQIRVHLSAIGHPVYADPLYGKSVEGSRLWLHAEKLSFEHPITGKHVEAVSEVPKDLLESAKSLGFSAPAES